VVYIAFYPLSFFCDNWDGYFKLGKNGKKAEIWVIRGRNLIFDEVDRRKRLWDCKVVR
jgi:hypothetical protein